MDTEVIETRLKMLDDYVRDLQPMQNLTLEEYREDKILRGYVERTLQLCIQICLDIGTHLIAELGLRRPEDSRDVFTVLGEGGILSADAVLNLRDMAGFRNIIVHDYTRVDNAIVHAVLTTHLDDFRAYAAAIAGFIETQVG